MPEPTRSEPTDGSNLLEHQLEPDRVPSYLVCSISCQVFRDPVVCMDGHTYERECIERWLQEHDSSPMTNLPLPSKVVVPNRALRQEIDQLARQQSLNTHEEMNVTQSA